MIKDLARTDMEQYKIIYEDMIDDVKNLKRLFQGYLGGELR